MENKSNYFQGTKSHPWHLSVGAVVINKEQKVAVHYFENLQFQNNTFKKLYLLMRETIEPGEGLEEALHRGLLEEFGMKAKLITYIGSLHSSFPASFQGYEFDKTTLYFLMEFESQDESLRGGDIESTSEIKWMEMDELISIMKKQRENLGFGDTGEFEVIERVQNYKLLR